jgi:hypothetical protein
MVEVIVGEAGVVWLLHEQLLATMSAFFKTAMASGFKEGLERKVTLVEDNNLVFQLFVEYLYTTKFHGMSLPLLAEAYVLGDKLGAPGFQADALDKMFELCKNSQCQLTAEQGLWIFRNTRPGCGLWRFTVDTIAHNVLDRQQSYGKEDWEMLGSFLPEVMDTVNTMLRMRNGEIGWGTKTRLAYCD